ncbi:MAG: SET domain-containing protein-lysine N-methyltransferase [Pseudomonadota bacterium]
MRLNGLGSLCNTALHSKRNNAKFKINHQSGDVWVVSTRNIIPGEQVLVPYGKGYIVKE